MKRKDYRIPKTKVVNLQQRQQLLVGSNPASTSATIDDYKDGEFSWEDD